MAKQTTVRLPDDLADEADAVARIHDTSVNALIIEALRAEIERLRSDDDFNALAKRLIKRDKELLERLSR
jgi:predicted transcriptional regulator